MDNTQKYIQFIENNFVRKDGKILVNFSDKFIQNIDNNDLYYEIRDLYAGFNLPDIYKILKLNNGVADCERCSKTLYDRLSKKSHLIFVCKECASSGRGKQAVETFRKKHGIDSYLSTEEGRQKHEKTMLERYGVKNAIHVDGAIQRRENTNLKLYGETYSIKTQKSKDLYKQTMLNKYGVEHNFTVKYDNSHWLQRNLDENAKHYYDNVEALYSLYVAMSYNLVELSDATGIPHLTIGRLFRKNGYKVIYRKHSVEEKEFHKKIEVDTGMRWEGSVRNIIPPFEIDIYNHDKRIGIEYHGLFWHSSIDNNVDYRMLEKKKRCDDRNVRLFQFLSNEVKEKPEIIMSMIKCGAGISDKIPASYCEVNFITDEMYEKFCELHHIQGYVAAKYKIGLFYTDELVSIMSFGKSTENKNFHYEITRFCTKLGVDVVGGESKLFEYFIDNMKPQSCIVYADNRHLNEEIYHEMGFIYSHVTEPNLLFVDKNANKVLENYSENESSIQNMLDMGHRILYDGGNTVFTWERSMKK